VKKQIEIDEALDELKKAYDMCTSPRTSFASDGKSITVDSEDQYDAKSLTDIMVITIELGLPDYVYDEMLSTNSLMGRQTETYEHYEVDWSSIQITV